MTQRAVLIGKYTIEEMPREPFNELLEKLWPIAFPDLAEYRYRELFTDQQRDNVEHLRERVRDKFALQLVVRHGMDIVGWSLGVQNTAEQFRMANSAVLPGHRRKGLYTALLKYLLDRVKGEGFQTVTSHHHLTNNPVLIAKLKAGFIITGMEVTDAYGTLVNLTYFFDDRRRDAVAMRIGARRPAPEFLQRMDRTRSTR